MFRYFHVLVLVLSIGAVGACGKAPARQEEPEATKIPISRNTSIDPGAMASLSWWHNEEYVAELQLSPEQQERMDAHLEDLLRGWQPSLEKRKGARRRFAEAVQKGDIAGARQIAEDFGRAEAFFKSEGLVLKADVLGELNQEQLQILIEKHPELLKSRWISSSRLKTRRRDG